MNIQPSKSLSARQSFICAALTGWKGDSPTSWPYPPDADTIISWARSYNPQASDDEMRHTFDDMVDEGLFKRLYYPIGIFRKPYYFCSFNSHFIDELPNDLGNVIDDFHEKIATKENLKILWDYLFDSYCNEYGPFWVWWGLCHNGDSSLSPCHGPSCQSYHNGNTKCGWELEFVHGQPDDWPEMSFIDDNMNEESVFEESYQKAYHALVSFKKADHTLPWPPGHDNDEINV